MKLFKKFSFLVLFVTMSGILFAAYSLVKDGSVTVTSSNEAVSASATGNTTSTQSQSPSSGLVASAAAGSVQAAAVSERIVFAFTGDVMLAGNVETAINTRGGGDYRYPWAIVAGYLRQVDVSCINLESVITDKGVKDTSTSGVKYRANPLAISGLQYAGIDVVSLANDHAFDYGKLGMEDCIGRIRSAGMSCIGAGLTYEEAYLPTYVTVKGLKIAFLALTTHGNSAWRARKASVNIFGRVTPASSGTAYFALQEFEQGIARARADNADLIVVSLHYGNEYSGTPGSTQDSYAHHAIDRGADIVVGHGAHVTQPTVVYGKDGDTDGYISYSLGNFIYDQREASYYYRGVTKGKVLEVVWENGGISSVIERKVLINETTWQPGPG